MQKYLKRFNEISPDYLNSDKHIHSQWTDGKGTILQIAERANRLGLNHIAITDHIRSDSSYFPKYFDEIRRIRRRYSFNILVGVEVKIRNFNGDIDIPGSALKRAEIKVASVHRFPIGRKLYTPHKFSKRLCQEIELELSLAALKKGGFDVLGHPGAMSLKFFGEFPIGFFKEIALKCRKSHIAFEVNSFYHKSALKQLKSILKEHNPLVSIGSEAHNLKDVGSCLSVIKGQMGS